MVIGYWLMVIEAMRGGGLGRCAQNPQKSGIKSSKNSSKRDGELVIPFFVALRLFFDTFVVKIFDRKSFNSLLVSSNT